MGRYGVKNWIPLQQVGQQILMINVVATGRGDMKDGGQFPVENDEILLGN
jgi:hypothetical protein